MAGKTSYWELREAVSGMVNTPDWLTAHSGEKHSQARVVQERAHQLLDTMLLYRHPEIDFGKKSSIGLQDLAMQRLSHAYIDAGLAAGESSAHELAKGLAGDISTLLTEKLGRQI